MRQHVGSADLGENTRPSVSPSTLPWRRSDRPWSQDDAHSCRRMREMYFGTKSGTLSCLPLRDALLVCNSVDKVRVRRREVRVRRREKWGAEKRKMGCGEEKKGVRRREIIVLWGHCTYGPSHAKHSIDNC